MADQNNNVGDPPPPPIIDPDSDDNAAWGVPSGHRANRGDISRFVVAPARQNPGCWHSIRVPSNLFREHNEALLQAQALQETDQRTHNDSEAHLREEQAEIDLQEPQDDASRGIQLQEEDQGVRPDVAMSNQRPDEALSDQDPQCDGEVEEDWNETSDLDDLSSASGDTKDSSPAESNVFGVQLGVFNSCQDVRRRRRNRDGDNQEQPDCEEEDDGHAPAEDEEEMSDEEDQEDQDDDVQGNGPFLNIAEETEDGEDDAEEDGGELEGLDVEESEEEEVPSTDKSSVASSSKDCPGDERAEDCIFGGGVLKEAQNFDISEEKREAITADLIKCDNLRAHYENHHQMSGVLTESREPHP